MLPKKIGSYKIVRTYIYPHVSAVNRMATRRLALSFSRGYTYISKIKDTNSYHLDKLKIVGKKVLGVLRNLTDKVRLT